VALPEARSRRSGGTGRNPLGETVREVGLQKLLSTRICDLELRPTSTLAECVEQVISEMRSKKITFVPAFYLGDDDFWTADRAVSVNIPWYLSTPDLWRLVNDHLFEYSRDEVLMYLRHEAGHALNYAYGLWRRHDWVQMFGDFRRPYRDVYTPNPWSRDFVRYLHWTGMYHYAQKHPDEDWAETFAVWLDPTSRWRRRYRDWQVASAKLEYVDRILEVERVCAGSPLNARLGTRVPYTEIRETVAEYFDIGDAVDEDLVEYRKDLMEIFPRQSPRTRPLARERFGHTAQSLSAARFIQQHQHMLVDRLSGWIGNSDKRVIRRFLRQLQGVCTEERLIVPESRRTEKLVELTIVATWHVVDGIHKLS
jgi:hypothetical protein